MSGFVVCPKCGTRIKAGRGHCLKCFEILPDPDLPVAPPLSESLGLSRNTAVGVWIAAGAAAVVLAAVIWQTWPTPVDDVAHPVDVAPIAASRPAGATPESREPATSVPDPEPAAPAEPVSSATAAPEADLDASRADYEQKLAGRPKDPDLLNKLGLVLERMGRHDQAASRFERAIAAAPLEPVYRLNLARAAGQLGQTDRAIGQYREVVRLRPRDYDTLHALGLALQTKGDDQAAVVEFAKARKVNPSAPDAAFALATSLEKVGRVDEAVAVFQEYLDIGPSPAEAAKVRAHLALLSRGRSQVK